MVVRIDVALFLPRSSIKYVPERVEFATEYHDTFAVNEERRIVPSDLYLLPTEPELVSPMTYNVLQQLSLCWVWMLNYLECANTMGWKSKYCCLDNQTGQRRRN